MKWRWACLILAACSGNNNGDSSPTLNYLTLSATELDFAAPLGVTTTATLTATNENAVPTYATPTLDPLFTDPGFSIASTDCPGDVGLGLAPGASCTVTIAFTPEHLGLSYDESSIEVGNSFATLVGNGAVALTVSPTSQDFGLVYTDQNSAPFVFTIQNTTDVAQHPKPKLLDNGTWGYVISNSTCDEIPPLGSCTLSIELQGAFTGTRTATLDVDGADAALTGVDLNEGSPQLYNEPFGGFGDIGIYQAPQTNFVQIVNGTHADLPSIEISIIDATAPVFSIGGNSCTHPVADGASCYVDLTATPMGTGLAKAKLLAQTPGIPDHTLDLSVHFFDDGPRIAISPSGTVALTPSVPIMFSITNPSSSFRFINSITVPSPYQISSDNCPGNVLAINSSLACTFTLDLVGSGDANQTLTVTWNTDHQDTVTLVPAN